MTDNVSPAKRAALLRNREKAQRLVESGREWEGLTPTERFERGVANQEQRLAARNVVSDALNYHFQGSAGRLLTGHEPAHKKERDKLEATARSFQYDERQEALLALKNRHDPKYDAFGSAEKISLGYYERAKAAAKELGLPTGDPTDG